MANRIFKVDEGFWGAPLADTYWNVDQIVSLVIGAGYSLVVSFADGTSFNSYTTSGAFASLAACQFERDYWLEKINAL